MKKLYIFILFVIIFLSGCVSPEERFDNQLDKALSEEFEYTQFYHDGFSISYPMWPKTENKDVELSVTKGYCSVVINSEKMNAKQWYGMYIDAVEKQNGTIIDSDDEKLHMEYSFYYGNLSMISDNYIYDCNNNGIVVSIVCIEQANKKTQQMHKKIFESAHCEESEKEEVKYSTFKDNDFSIKHPNWDELTDESEQRILGLSKGVCSIIVDKHNALPKDIFNWVVKSIDEQEDHKLLDKSEGDIYSIIYELPYENNTITATTKVFYCNYQSYVTQVLCVNELIDEDFEEIRNYVIDSSKCSKKYEIPTPKKIEEVKKEVKKEEPEVIEEIEDQIVKTNIGEEFGIDENMVVYFINNNEFFGKIMKDFPKANIVIEDKNNDCELKLKVNINNKGKITLLEDGGHNNPDVTLLMPLRDALNIFSNAQNINPLTLLSFAVNVRTVPVGIKDEVIKKVLRGEYN